MSSRGRSGGALIRPQHRNLIVNKNHNCNAKHCSWNADRHGKRRVRFRKGGFSSYPTGTPWSEDFMRQYAAVLDGVKEQTANIGAVRTKPGSFDALCVS